LILLLLVVEIPQTIIGDEERRVVLQSLLQEPAGAFNSACRLGFESLVEEGLGSGSVPPRRFY
jgi:hypothetical protein